MRVKEKAGWAVMVFGAVAAAYVAGITKEGDPSTMDFVKAMGAFFPLTVLGAHLINEAREDYVREIKVGNEQYTFRNTI